MNRSDHNQKALLLRPSAASLPANTRIVEEIQREFGELSFEIIDVHPIMRRKRLVVLINSLQTLWLYRRDLLSRRKRFRQCFWRTPYIHDAIRKTLRRLFQGGLWAFTFQIQSLFDGSLEGIPHFVYTDHTHLANLTYSGFSRSDLYHPSWIRKEKEVYANATEVFVWSTNMLGILQREYGIADERMACVFAGVNADVPAEWVPPDADVKPSRILFVGVDWPRKGGPDLLDAFSLVKGRFPDLELTVISAFEGEADKSLPGISFLGRVPVDEVGEHFERSHVFCMPTHVEPFGIVFIEAMAHGLPIVSTRIGALPDLVEQGVTGYLVPAGDVPALAEALESVLSNIEQFHSMSMAARRTYETSFTWKAVFASIRERIVNHVSLLH